MSVDAVCPIRIHQFVQNHLAVHRNVRLSCDQCREQSRQPENLAIETMQRYTVIMYKVSHIVALILLLTCVSSSSNAYQWGRVMSGLFRSGSRSATKVMPKLGRTTSSTIVKRLSPKISKARVKGQKSVDIGGIIEATPDAYNFGRQLLPNRSQSVNSSNPASGTCQKCGLRRGVVPRTLGQRRCMHLFR
jgi:hypothetical protein